VHLHSSLPRHIKHATHFLTISCWHSCSSKSLHSTTKPVQMHQPAGGASGLLPIDRVQSSRLVGLTCSSRSALCTLLDPFCCSDLLAAAAVIWLQLMWISRQPGTR
jgi:hypothetical protein